MESALKFHHARVLLEWQVELGATEAIGDVPVNRFDLPQSQPKPKHKLKNAASESSAQRAVAGDAGVDATALAGRLAAKADD